MTEVVRDLAAESRAVQDGHKMPFPELVDNSMRGDFISCPRKFYWAYVRKLAPAFPNIHLHAGGAFAAGLEACKRSFYEQGHSEAEAMRDGLAVLIKAYGPIQLPPSRTGDKSCENIIRAYDSYFNRYPLGRDFLRPHMAANGKAMLEFTFAIPTEVKHPQTGNPILYGGRSDEIGEMEAGGTKQLMVGDEKTTTSLGEQWASQWDLESQFTGYVLAALQYGLPVAGVVVRGIGLLKTKISHQETLVYRSQWVIDRWWVQLQRDIQRMVRSWEENYFDYAVSKNSCAAYGGCPFKMLTESPTPEDYVAIHYRPRTWDPMAKDHGEKLLENPELTKEIIAPELTIPGLS
jgi:hypothetical protein